MTDFSKLDAALSLFSESVVAYKQAVQTGDQKDEALAAAQKAKEDAQFSRDEADTKLEAALSTLTREFKALDVSHSDEAPVA